MIKKIKNFGHSVFSLALVTGGSDYQGVNLTIQSVFGIITGLACWFTRFALILVVIYIVFYGIKFMMAQGNETKYGEAKKSFTWGLVGVLVILGTYTIILTVADFIGGPTATLFLSRFIPLACP